MVPPGGTFGSPGRSAVSLSASARRRQGGIHERPAENISIVGNGVSLAGAED